MTRPWKTGLTAMQRMRDERGQLAAPIMFIVIALLTAGFWFFQIGRASLLQARVTTAADAGALAGAEELKRQYIEYLETYALSGAPFIPNVPFIAAKAADYTARNDGVMTPSGFRVDPIRMRVTVSAVNAQSMDGDFGISDRGDRGAFTSMAEVTISWTFGPSTFSGGGGGGGGGGSGADKIAGLDPDFQVAVNQLNAAMNGTLQINSGYRSPADQARVCREAPPGRPCAPPGRSMHQQGLAIDVQNYGEASRVLAQHPEINMCWPNIPNDAFHFSYGDGRECGGTRGSGSGGNGLQPAGQLFGGGGVGSVAGFNVHLVSDNYGLGGLGGGGGGFEVPGDLNGNGGLGDPSDPASWEALAQCESSGNPRAVNQQTGAHFGLFQFDIPTWQSVGGTGNPIDASAEEQLMRARMLYSQRGWQPWECAANMGWDMSGP